MLSSPSGITPVARDPEFVAVILAGRFGSRLFPLTSDVDQQQQQTTTTTAVEERNDSWEDSTSTGNGAELTGKPRAKLKHLLPLGGEPVLVRLLHTIQCSGDINHVIVAVAQNDHITLSALKEHYKSCAIVSTTPIYHSSISLLSKAGNNSTTADDGAATTPPGNHLATLTTITIVSGQPTVPTTTTTHKTTSSTSVRHPPFTISLVHLKSSHCVGSADAVRYLSSLTVKSENDLNPKKFLLPLNSNILLMAADIVLEGRGILGLLAEAHRRGQVIGASYQNSDTTCSSTSFAISSITMLLSDVGDEDENGIPLKESAKHKKGSLARNEEDIEYIALSSYPKSHYSYIAAATGPTTVLPSERVIFKRCKIDVEDDLNKTGQTPKLILSKVMLRNPASHTIRIRTDLDDIHLYALAPWIIRLIQVRTDLSSIQKEVIPLLTSRQFKGVHSAFGSKIHKFSKEKLEAVKTCLPVLWETIKSISHGGTNPRKVLLDVDEQNEHDDDAQHYEEEDNTFVGGGQGVDEGREKLSHPLMYHVSAVVLPRGQRLVLRASTVNHYLYASRELVAHALQAPTKEEMLLLYHSNPHSTTPSSPASEEALYTAVGSTFTPLGGTISSKFSTLILPDATIGEKATLKSCTVGRYCKIGNKCRLNNVVIMDHATIGDNCVLQNSIVGESVVIGDNCNFNDVQVGPGAIVRSGTRCKNESIASGEKSGASATALDGRSSDDEDDSFR